jgi:hypothetical protein
MSSIPRSEEGLKVYSIKGLMGYNKLYSMTFCLHNESPFFTTVHILVSRSVKAMTLYIL